MIYRWIKQQSKLKSSTKQTATRNIGSGRTALYPTEERIVVDYIIKERASVLPGTWKKVQNFMKTFVPSTFKASFGWIQGFSKRFSFTLRKPTSSIYKNQLQSQRQLSIAETISNFDFYYQQSQCAKYKPENIINMDETPVWSDAPITKVIDKKGSKRVQLIKQR